MYAANRPDLVLLDINMPLMNGFELAQMIREQDCDVRRIMDITQEAIRSTRYRIQQNMKK